MFTKVREVWSDFTGLDIRKYIKMWGRGFALPIYFIFIKYPVKMKQFGFTETKLFHSIFKVGVAEGVQTIHSGSATEYHLSDHTFQF